MRDVARRSIWLVALALLLAACGTAAATLTPSTAAPTQEVVVTDTPTATAAAPAASPTPLQKPPAPTNFTATDRGGGSVPCPSPNAADNCHVADLAWKSTAASGTWFKIYESWTGEGGATCTDAQPDESVAIQTAPNARTATLYTVLATGGGARCLWITAVNGAGESAQVAVAGQ